MSETWTWKPGLVTWSFSVPGQAHQDAQANLELSTTAVLELVAPFARVSDIEVVTAERGDDAFVFVGSDIARIGEAFSSEETIQRVSLTLDLAVNDGTETWLDDAASIDLNRPDGNATSSDISVWFSLDVDIYASKTWGKSRDNAQLARINGPRLTAFLQRLRERLHARVTDIDAGDYPGQLTGDGFV
jgi:hypothetical protein